jgi:transposase
MTNRRIEMYEYRQIIYRLRLGQSEREIARDVIAGRKVIHRIKLTAEKQGWLSPATPLPDESVLRQCLSSATAVKQESSLKIHEAEIKKWVAQGIQATVIYRYLTEHYDLKLHYNAVQRFVKKLIDAEPVSMTVPLHFKPGEAAQVDFGKGSRLLDERTGQEVETWFFVMTLCWSRHQYVELVVHQDIETWLN